MIAKKEQENMSKDDFPVAGTSDGVDGREHRRGDRRARDEGSPRAEQRGPDRRQSQSCFHCGNKFKPTPLHTRVCPNCRNRALQKGAAVP